MPTIAAPGGIPLRGRDVSVNVGHETGGGAVNVGRRVTVGSAAKAATNVGSSVAVASGGGVGGGSTTCNAPVKVTYAA